MDFLKRLIFVYVGVITLHNSSAVLGMPGDEGEDRVIHILSIDGGGMRGLLPAQALMEVEEKLTHPLRIGESFDLIAGTSTGGILALGLAVKDEETGRPKYTVKEIKEIYAEHGKRIFPESQRKKVLKSYFKEKYDEIPLEGVAKGYFGLSSLRDVVTPVIITSYDVSNERLYLFDSEKARRSEHDNFYLKDVARATSAAPTYFKAAEIRDLAQGRRYTFVDGGVVCNNPALRAYFKARELYSKAKGYTLLSIGTGSCPRLYVSGKLEATGKLSWATQIPNLMMSGMSQEVHDILRLYSQGYDPTISLRYNRFQANLSEEETEMDLSEERIVQRWIGIGSKIYDDNEGAFQGVIEESLSHGVRTLKKYVYEARSRAESRFPGFREKREETELDLVQLGIRSSEDVRRILGYFNETKKEGYVLQKLYLSQNALRSIDGEEVFPQGLVEGLYKLQLDQNKIERLPATMFSYMGGLQTVNLSRNKIKELPAGVFDALRALRILYLNDNELEEVPEDLFKNQGNLEELRLEKNKFPKFPSTVFHPLTALKKLDLRENSLRELAANQFQGIPLEILDLRGNYFLEMAGEEEDNKLHAEMFTEYHPDLQVVVAPQKFAKPGTLLGSISIDLPQSFL